MTVAGTFRQDKTGQDGIRHDTTGASNAVANANVQDRIGVCSWSLKPKDPADLVAKLKQVELNKVQLALGPLIKEPAWADAGGRLKDAGVTIVSGMMGCVGEDYSSIAAIRRTGGVVPDETWPATYENMKKAAPVAQALGLKLVTFHAGFIPHDAKDPKFATVVQRIGQVADAFKAAGAQVALETGQERAEDLEAFLKALGRTDVGVNFDPANMLLYSSGEPVAAVKRLTPWLKQIHIKDATPGPDGETWGKEVAAGTGDVNWPGFFAALREGNYAGHLVIEREAGDQRVEDVRTARRFVSEKGN